MRAAIAAGYLIGVGLVYAARPEIESFKAGADRYVRVSWERAGITVWMRSR